MTYLVNVKRLKTTEMMVSRDIMGLFNRKSNEEKQVEEEALKELNSYKENTYLKFREISLNYGLTRAGYSEGRFFNKILKTLKKEIKKEGLTANGIEGRVHDFFKEKYGEPIISYEKTIEDHKEYNEESKTEEELTISSKNEDLILDYNDRFNNTPLKNAKYCLRCNAEMEESLDICPNCHFNFKTNFYDFEDRSIFKSETFDKLTKGTLNFINIDAEQKSSSKKAKYNYNSKELFVEEVAMEYYQNLGYAAIWGENFYWETLYSLLFWDIIFMKTDTCTPYPMNHEKFEDYYNMLINTNMLDMPNDFFNENFYLVRRDAINHKLKQFKNNPDSILKTLDSSYQNNYGKRCRGIYDWDKFKLEELKIPIECLEKEQILLIFDKMLHDFAYYRSGFPDLIVMNKEEFFFVEVKSKNDSLSERQVEWHDYLMNEVKIDVNIFSVNKTERQINNLKKKYNNIPKKDYSFKLSFDINELSLEDLRNLSGDELTERQNEIDKFGLELIKIGKVEEAKKLFEANVRNNSPFETSYKQLSIIYGREQRYDDAIKVCELGMKNVKNKKGFFFESRINAMKTTKRTYNL